MVPEVVVAMRYEGVDKSDVEWHQCDRSAENIAARIELGAQRCQCMKSSHELDERVVVAETVGPRDVEGHHQ